jgi:hypothetical protein
MRPGDRQVAHEWHPRSSTPGPSEPNEVSGHVASRSFGHAFDRHARRLSDLERGSGRRLGSRSSPKRVCPEAASSRLPLTRTIPTVHCPKPDAFVMLHDPTGQHRHLASRLLAATGGRAGSRRPSSASAWRSSTSTAQPAHRPQSRAEQECHPVPPSVVWGPDGVMRISPASRYAPGYAPHAHSGHPCHK